MVNKHPKLLAALDQLIEPTTRGDPESPLRWTCKSARNLAENLSENGYVLGRQSVVNILNDQGYSLQSNRKNSEGKKGNPDRNEQFLYISKCVSKFLKSRDPVISVDTKKKELIGKYKNNGQEWKSKDSAVEVLSHDFLDPKVPKAVPYGVTITVCHFPPGTSKWNKIEHRLFSFISMNWRGQPRVDYQTVVNLIAATTTKTGLTVKVRLDKNKYEKGIKVSAEEIKNLKIKRHEFHGEWNYTLKPH